MWGCEAETSHLVRRSRKRERPSVPESVLTFSSGKIGNLDKSPEPHTASLVVETDLVFIYTLLSIFVRHLRVFQPVGRKKKINVIFQLWTCADISFAIHTAAGISGIS